MVNELNFEPTISAALKIEVRAEFPAVPKSGESGSGLKFQLSEYGNAKCLRTQLNFALSDQQGNDSKFGVIPLERVFCYTRER